MAGDDDTQDFIPAPKLNPLTADKAAELMKKGTWSSTNSNSADRKMVEYITVFAKDITALGLPLDRSTQKPFGLARQVTSWGAIHHSGEQYEIPLATLEKAAGVLIDDVVHGKRPSSAGKRPSNPDPDVEGRWRVR